MNYVICHFIRGYLAPLLPYEMCSIRPISLQIYNLESWKQYLCGFFCTFQVYEETEKLKADVSSYVQASSAQSNEKLLTDNYVKLNVAKMLSNNTKMYFSGGDSLLGASLSKIFGGVVNPNQKMCYLHTNILKIQRNMTNL